MFDLDTGILGKLRRQYEDRMETMRQQHESRMETMRQQMETMRQQHESRMNEIRGNQIKNKTSTTQMPNEKNVPIS
jgi:hypothetical protein